MPWAKHFLSSGQNPDTGMCSPDSPRQHPQSESFGSFSLPRPPTLSPVAPTQHMRVHSPTHTCWHTSAGSGPPAHGARALAGPSQSVLVSLRPPCPGPRLCGFACLSALSPDPGVLSQDVETPDVPRVSGRRSPAPGRDGGLLLLGLLSTSPCHPPPPRRSAKRRKWVPEGFLHSFRTP